MRKLTPRQFYVVALVILLAVAFGALGLAYAIHSHEIARDRAINDIYEHQRQRMQEAARRIGGP